jgi:hypothetical protein
VLSWESLLLSTRVSAILEVPLMRVLTEENFPQV